MNTVLPLIPAAGLAAYGARLLFQTRTQLTEAQTAHDRRIENRMMRGSDAYADELRSLQAYRPIASIRQRRLLGFLLLALSLGYIALFFFVPE